MANVLYQRRASTWAQGLAQAETESLARAAAAPPGRNIEQALELSSLTPGVSADEDAVSLVELWKRRLSSPEQ